MTTTDPVATPNTSAGSSDRPTSGTWAIEPSHSSVEAVARHLMVTKVRGRFAGIAGTVEIPDRLEEAVVDVTIDAASIDTGDAQRDGHLKSPDFLDVATHPALTFHSTSAVHVGGDRWELPGELTIRGVTRPVTLQATYLGKHQDPWGNERLVAEATAELDREAFGMTWNQALETGGVLVSRTLQVEIGVQLVRQEA